MKKKYIINALKIIIVILWLAVLFTPTIFVNTQDVKSLDFAWSLSSDESEGYDYFDVEFSHEVIEGEITVGYYNLDFELDHTVTVSFEQEASKVVTIAVPLEGIPEDAIIPDFESASVLTKQADLINKIMYPIAIVIAVALFFVLRLNVKEFESEDRKVEIYSGLVNHHVKVDGIKVYAERYLFTRQKTTLEVPLSERLSMKVVFRANNKIETYPISKQVEDVETATLKSPSEDVSTDSKTEEVDKVSTIAETVETAEHAENTESEK